MPSTMLLRIESPLQAWAYGKYTLTRTRRFPTKSGIIGLLLACMGVRREDAADRITELRPLLMGVRADRPGSITEDFHTTETGDRAILRGKGEGEPRDIVYRELIADASFLVALSGPVDLLRKLEVAVKDPVFPPYFGRRAFVPSRPIFEGVSTDGSLTNVLAAWPWRASRVFTHYGTHVVGEIENAGEIVLQDVPVRLWPHLAFTYRNVGISSFRPPVVIPARTACSAEARPQPSKEMKQRRMARDHNKCVLCYDVAAHVHHVTYIRCGSELLEDLRSVCELCHEACTRIEYGRLMNKNRTDPDRESVWRAEVMRVRELVLHERGMV